jgi:hypothetical protein
VNYSFWWEGVDEITEERARGNYLRMLGKGHVADQTPNGLLERKSLFKG